MTVGGGKLPGRGRALDLLPRVIARPYERARLHVAITHRHAEASQLGELVGPVVARDGEVLTRGSEILADGQDIHALTPEIAHGQQQLIPLLAEAANESRLGEQAPIELLGLA